MGRTADHAGDIHFEVHIIINHYYTTGTLEFAIHNVHILPTGLNFVKSAVVNHCMSLCVGSF